jgi:hypothetical protein
MLAYLVLGQAVVTLLVAPALAQQHDARRVGLPHDWSHHHLILTNTKSLDVVSHPEVAKRLQNDPHLLAHVIDSNARWHARRDHDNDRDNRSKNRKQKPKIDWSISLGGGSTGLNQYPAKYTFDVTAFPDCIHDFVVFPINVPGSSSQPNIVGFNYLYSGGTQLNVGLCNANTPATPAVTGSTYSGAVYFSYNVNAIGGAVLTSPAISLDGSKIAFVESAAGTAPHFHVLAFKAGDGVNGANPVDVTTPVQITSFVSTQPAAGQATDLQYSTCTAGNGNSNSSPYVDYTNDLAYIGDDCGNIVRIQNVFCPNGCSNAAPSLDTTFNNGSGVFNACGPNTATAPVLDPAPSGTGDLFMGCSNGRMYRIVPGTSTTNASQTSHAGGGTSGNGGISDPPLVDTTNGFVYWTNPSDLTGAILAQNTTTLFGATTTIEFGEPGVNPVHAGTFNDPYFDSADTTTWEIIVCGFSTAGANPPELFSIGFTTGGVITGTPTGNTNGMGATGGAQCSPITDFLGGDGTDRIFFGIDSGVFNMFNVGTSSTINFPFDSITPTSVTETGGTSGVMVDNTSSVGNASSVYFSTLGSSNCSAGSCQAVKLTQARLE